MAVVVMAVAEVVMQEQQQQLVGVFLAVPHSARRRCSVAVFVVGRSLLL